MRAKRADAKTDRSREMYRWWFEYLRCYPKYIQHCEQKARRGPFAKVYRDFGDVQAITFEDWWDKKQSLLLGQPMEPFTIHPLKSEQAFRAYTGDNSVMIVAVNLYEPKEQLTNKFAKMISAAAPRRAGRPARDPGLSEYPISGYRTIAFLQTALDVWKANKQRPAGTPLWKVAQGVGVGPSLKTGSKEEDPGGINRRKIDTMARRYIKQAEQIMDNAARGRFPVCSNGR
jgi:hypothetical protein